MIVNLLCTFLLAGFYTIGWPIGILGLIMSFCLFFISQLYADAILQLMLLLSFIYGWYSWRSDLDKKTTAILRLKLIDWAKIVLIIIILGELVSLLLKVYADSTTPYMDGFTCVASLVCVFLASRKIIDNWILWMIVDSAYVILYLYKDLVFASITTIIYLLVAVYGYKHWKELMN